MPPARLINTLTYALHKNVPSPEYAILSHKWVEPEVTFQQLDSTEWRTINLKSQPMKKIRDACEKARGRRPPIQWLWVDTCCIDKTNSVELASALNSMFEWYFGAAVCYGYLYDVEWVASSRQISKSTDLKRPGKESAWFERGWTLQELLAPRYMEFYDADWNFMDTRKNLADLLRERTGIAEQYLTGASNFKVACVATKMSWMAGRTTTAVEDIAYSMLGLFNITMDIRYGEGAKAFMRLQRTLIESSIDESLFAWTTPTSGLTCYQGLGKVPKFSPTHWGLLAPSPDCFSKSRDLVVLPDLHVARLAGGYRMTQQGVVFEMPFASEVTNFLGLARTKVTLGLNCWRYGPNGKPYNIGIRLLGYGSGYRRVKLEDDLEKTSKPKTKKSLGTDQVLTRPLTISQPEFDSFT
ncbi:MAG: hypothetical protein LQ338_006193 [Usnochroma carphineum]|nr:MAG: hypothetical protein LQ338_006193 [Usnochroma carphineum]